jgi:CDGSH-type Zn-finger protein
MTKDKPKPQIAPLPNGPYYYLNDFTPHEVLGIKNSKGEKVSNIRGAALCRCGGSQNKPFCDGTHGRIGFSDRKETDGHLDRRIDYKGKEITVHDNRGICSHVGYCTDNLPSVFKLGEEPWIDPNGASKEEIIKTIEKCPSGALSYSINGKEHRDFGQKPEVIVSKNGPYCACGGIEVVGHKNRADKVSEEHCTLCRCGSSKNKPFCDGGHWNIGFKDEKN